MELLDFPSRSPPLKQLFLNGSLQYATYREEGLPIGSGAAEAGCKTLVQSRMKRSGMNWSPRGAENMLALRADSCERVAVIP